MKVFVVQRKDNDALSKGINLDHAQELAWSHDIREAALYADETRAVKCRDAVRALGIEARVMVLAPQPW